VEFQPDGIDHSDIQIEDHEVNLYGVWMLPPSSSGQTLSAAQLSPLVEAFKRFQDLGILEIFTCAATHGFLPLMEKHPGSVRAQILIARDEYQKPSAGNRAAFGFQNAPIFPDLKTICKRLSCVGFPWMRTV
jgi:hypothetical protein